jgi:hypothetical protein
MQPFGGQRYHRDHKCNQRDHIEDQRVPHERDVALYSKKFHNIFLGGQA